MDREPLRSTGGFMAEEGLGTAFARRSWHLCYQMSGGCYCGNCVLPRRVRP
ncbi:hypothetical protein [Streptomyces sp. NPDC002671]